MVRAPLFALAVPLALAALAACSSTSAGGDAGARGDAGPVADAGAPNDTGTSPVPDATPELQIRPAEMYTGTDGARAFRVPVAVYGAGPDLKVALSDPAAATVEPATLVDPTGDDGRYSMLNAKKAGTFTVTASSGGRNVTASLTIASYPAARYAAGEARYKVGFAPKSEPPCTQCHAGADGIDHSPASLASVSDEDVAVIISTGILNGVPIVLPSGGKHQWTTTPAEMDGLVTYLRALPPKGFR